MKETSIFPNYVFDKTTGWRMDLPAFIPLGTRVLCLYRVSTGQQLYRTENNEADIPMQRKRCRQFAEQMGWTVVCELQEEGVSGHKVRAANRDKIQTIKEYASKGKFDILLVFMFDRIGRISDETPFVVEWFIRNGIRVWSATEGEQKIESHTDRLTNFIRYWQADGESQKTSVRTANSLHILTEEGYYTGGTCPYGYNAVKQGRTNKRKQDVTDLVICEEEAYIVQLIFKKASTEGYGAQRIANFLNSNGYKNRSGKNWHPSSINGMLRNIQYVGIMRSGESRSEVQEHLRIVDDKTFDMVQCMLAVRSKQNQTTRSAPINTRGESLLAGNVFCGHCGARLCITTSGQGRPRKDGTDTRRVRYTCQTKSRTHGDCDGQTGYTLHILDEKIDMLVRSILAKAKRMTRTEIMLACYNNEVGNKKAFVKKAERDLEKAEAGLRNLTQELQKVLSGESQFTPQMLNIAYMEQEQRCTELREALAKATQELDNDEAKLQEISGFYDDMLEWAFAYDKASMSAKKMIVSHLIDRVYVFRDYRLQIKFNMSIEQFLISLMGAA